jgi:hypothetical protein
VAPRTTVHQSIANRRVRFDVAYPIIDARPDPLSHSELALEHLTPPPNGPERIAPDYKERGVRGHHVAPACADLLLERFLDASVLGIRGLGDIGELRVSWDSQQP